MKTEVAWWLEAGERAAGQALADCEAVKRFVEDHLGA